MYSPSLAKYIHDGPTLMGTSAFGSSHEKLYTRQISDEHFFLPSNAKSVVQGVLKGAESESEISFLIIHPN